MMLGVSPDHVLRLAEGGHLTRLGRPARFVEEEVRELSRTRKLGHKASMVAFQALALAKRLERELAEIKMLLRIDSVNLSVEEKDVVQLFVQVEGICSRGALDLLEVDRWLKTLLAVDEAYLKLVEKTTGEEDPWVPYLSLAQLIFQHTNGRERAKADYVRRNLRNVGYMYTRRKHGAVVAESRFRDGSYMDKLLGTVLSDFYP